MTGSISMTTTRNQVELTFRTDDTTCALVAAQALDGVGYVAERAVADLAPRPLHELDPFEWETLAADLRSRGSDMVERGDDDGYCLRDAGTQIRTYLKDLCQCEGTEYDTFAVQSQELLNGLAPSVPSLLVVDRTPGEPPVLVEQDLTWDMVLDALGARARHSVRVRVDIAAGEGTVAFAESSWRARRVRAVTDPHMVNLLKVVASSEDFDAGAYPVNELEGVTATPALVVAATQLCVAWFREEPAAPRRSHDLLRWLTPRQKVSALRRAGIFDLTEDDLLAVAALAPNWPLSLRELVDTLHCA